MFVEDYESAKFYDALPRFSTSFYDYLYGNDIGITKESIIADVGCGTGRLMIDFLIRGNKVYGIDPDKNMRDICMKKCYKYDGKFELINGTENNTNLLDKSVDYVVVSQVYHRFNPKSFKKECDRILKNKNNVLIIWYRVDFNAPIFREMLQSIKEVYLDYKTRYNTTEIEGAKLEEIENNEIAQQFFDYNSNMKNIVSTVNMNRNEFIELGLSLALFPITHEMNTVSKVLKEETFDKDEYLVKLNNIFDKYKLQENIELSFKVQIHSSKNVNC